ncbi:MAG: amidohydrolase family protein [Acidobacteriota bacterium]|nr:amidohydrolase family protein [Acidobacteriota bacterium]
MFERMCYFGLVIFFLGMAPGFAQEEPDMILYSGKILTVDEDFTIAEAVAINNGEITAVGNDTEVLKQAGQHTTKIDLEGKTVVPGLIDTHSHVQSYAERSHGGQLSSKQMQNYPINFRIVQSTEDVVNQIRQTLKAIDAQPGEWIHFSSRGISEHEHVEILFDQLDRWELDKASPNNPIVLSMGIPIENGYFINSLAIDILWNKYGDFINRYGRYWVDDQGRPDGHLEPPASRLVMTEFRPQPAPEDLAPVYNKTLEEWSAMGITTISTKLQIEDVEAYRLLEANGTLKARMAYGANWLFGRPDVADGLKNTKRGEGSTMVWMSSVTPVGLDGSGARQCTALERNNDAAGDQGTMGLSLIGAWYPNGQCHLDLEYRGSVGRGAPISGNYYREWLFEVAQHNHRVANMHVAGDRAQELYITALEQVNQERPSSVQNWALDHCTLVNPEDIARAARMGVVWSCAPKYIANYPSIARSYGEEIANQYLVPVKSMIDAGIHVAFELDRDAYVWSDLEMLITRMVDGNVFGAHERIDRVTALKMLTIWGAEYVLRENQLGSIEPGKLADLVVLDRDYMTIPEKEIAKIQALMTILGGETMYVHSDFADEIDIRPDNAVISTYQALKGRSN